MRLLVCRDDRYWSRYFDFQRAYRYVGTLRDSLQIEASAYEHYASGTPSTLAIDISTMVGCPLRCRYCAAASVPYRRPLKESEIDAQAELLLTLHGERRFPKITCSFQGIGDPALVPQTVIRAGRHVLSLDDRAALSLATTLADPKVIAVWGESGLPIDNLQISCSATTVEQARALVPTGFDPFRAMHAAVLARQYTSIRKVKLNYILLHGFNDSSADIERLVSLMAPQALTIKVSVLNQTAASAYYGFRPATLAAAQWFAAHLREGGIDSYVYGAFEGTNISCGQLLSLQRGTQDDA